MLFRDSGGQRHFGERFANTDDSFELTDSDRDAGSFVSVLFDLVHLTTDADEMGGEHFGGFVVETGCTARFRETDVRAHFINRNLTLCSSRNGPVDMNIQHMLRDRLLSALFWMGKVHDRDSHHEYP